MTNTESILMSPVAKQDKSEAAPSMIELAGYELKTLLGSGGYGDVWKAIGPGGFPKAVKVLYGRRDGEHAEAEIKALNRMRELRHPFLLNLERVEVCNNRLIVVTELADGNLNERFEKYIAQGHPGVPRDELLSYLRDAADALDFMCDEHGLQHLDIKPDNLLLQGKHIKLGDFGLAKDVSITNLSLINGFTPLYASPELFEGRPGRFSDQYSLAIVYQAMLTGKPPFNGRNAAQLTSQHLRSQPNLLPLPHSDRPVVARALSKSPGSRYATCRDLVDELMDRGRSRRPSKTVSVPAATTGAAAEKLSSDTESMVRKQFDAQPSTPRTALSTDVRNQLRPALFVGVGGAAGQILRQLKGDRQQFTDEAIPSWQVLAIDTNPDSLRWMFGLSNAAQLHETEALPITLKTSQQYRKAKHMDMSWLSRRWLFNIPRSGRVEGMRPLARLAVQDHLDAIRRRLRDRVSAALAADHVAQSATATGVPFAETELDVFVIAGTSGGTGSGAVADVGLVVQELKSEFPNVQINVSAVLFHSTSSQQRVEGIQAANTIACLKELRMLSMPQMGIPKGFSRDAAELQPFDTTWLFNCGELLSPQDFSEARDRIAQFVLRSVGTPAGKAWREATQQLPGEDTEPQIRLLGLDTVDSDVYSTAHTEAASLASAVVSTWMSPGTDAELPEFQQECVQELLKSLMLTADTLPERILKEMRGESGQRIEKLTETVVSRVENPADYVANALVAELQDLNGDAAGTQLRQLKDHLRRTLNRERDASGMQVRNFLLDLMARGGRKAWTVAADVIRAEVQAAADCCRQLSQEVEQALAGLISAPAPSGHKEQREFCRQFCVLTASVTIYQVFQELLHQHQTVCETAFEACNLGSQRLTEIRSSLALQHNVHKGIPEPVVHAFNLQLAEDPRFRLQTIAGPDFNAQQLAEQLTDRATGFLLAAGAVDQPPESTFPATAWPSIRGLAGQHRIAVWLPKQEDESAWTSRLTEEFGNCVTIIRHDLPRVAVACEVQNIECFRLLKYLQLHDRYAWDMAERIPTRIDVQW